MKTFKIDLLETVRYEVDIEADTFDAALDVAQNACKDGTIEDWALVEKDGSRLRVPAIQSGRT